MASNGLPAICGGEESTGTRIGLHLVCHEDRNVELLGNFGKFAEVLSELLLSLVELTATLIVAAEEVHDTVNNEQAVFTGCEHATELDQRFLLVFAVFDTPDSDVLVGSVGIHCDSQSRSASKWHCTGVLLKRSAMATILSGRNVPSVSRIATFPATPLASLGSCAVTHMV